MSKYTNFQVSLTVNMWRLSGIEETDEMRARAEGKRLDILLLNSLLQGGWKIDVKIRYIC
jgi:hypothetical protein